jgi:hypothetical protein
MVCSGPVAVLLPQRFERVPVELLGRRFQVGVLDRAVIVGDQAAERAFCASLHLGLGGGANDIGLIGRHELRRADATWQGAAPKSLAAKVTAANAAIVGVLLDVR